MVFTERYQVLNAFLNEKRNLIRCFFLSLPIDVIGTFINHQEYFSESPSHTYVMALTSQLFIFPIFLALITFKNKEWVINRYSGKYSNLVILAITGFSLGCVKTVNHYLLFGDFESAAQRVSRVTLSFPVTYLLSASIYQVIKQIRRNTQALRYQNELLKLEHTQLTSDLIGFQSEIKLGLNKRVMPSINELRSAIDARIKPWDTAFRSELSRAFGHFSNSIIRQESHNLYKRFDTKNGEDSGNLSLRDGKTKAVLEIFRYMQPPSLIAPAIIFGLNFLYGKPPCKNEHYILIFLLLIELVIFRELNKLKSKNLTYLGAVSIGILLLTTLAFFAFIKSNDFYLCRINQVWQLQNLGLILGFCLMIISSFYSSVIALMQSDYLALSEEKMLLRSQIREAKAILGSSSKSVANILHGEIQSGLAGISMALQIYQSRYNLVDTDEELEDLKLQVSDNLILIEARMERLLDLDFESAKSFEEAVVQMKYRWQGLLRIEVNYSEEVAYSLKRDDFLNKMVIEVLNELATNSVRHGNASSLKVSLEQKRSEDDGERLEIESNNNGASIEIGRRSSGLISLQIERLGGKIRFSPIPSGGVSTWVTIPL